MLKNFRKLLPSRNNSIMFLEQVGSGKTHLSMAISNILMENDINTMFEIINHRYFNGMPVVVSCEKSVDELLRIDEAIGSRLVEMCSGFIVEIKDRKLNYRLQ